MAQLSNQAFYEKWVPLLADNVFQDIDGPRFEQLLADVRDSFASMVGQNVLPVAPAVNFDPVLRQLTATHLLGTSELEYNQNNGGFTAYAPIQINDLGHPQGEYRFRVKAATGRSASQTTDSPKIDAKGAVNPAGPGKIKAIDISDSTEAGRALLMAADVTAQRKLLDNFVILAGQYGVGQPLFEHTAGEDGLYAYMLRALASVAVPANPAAPTEGQVDDRGDTFSFQPTAAYPSFAQYQVSGLPQTTGAEWLNGANSYVQNGRIYIRVVGAVDAGGLAVFVGASGAIPAGRVLTNDKPFTDNNLVPAVPGALQVDFTVDNASLSPGDTLTFTAKASGGTAPYQHSVQALNPDTGTVTVLGTASTASYVGTWKATAGVYLLTDAVTDAAGAPLVSSTRRVVVAAPGGGGGATLVPATHTRLGGVRIGAGLSIDVDGLLAADNLLDTDNTWTGQNTFSLGTYWANNSRVDAFGQAFFFSIDLDNRLNFRDGNTTLNKAGFFQWTGGDYNSEEAPVDVALARTSAGVLEVNTGTAGQRATLRVLDLVADVAPAAFNTFGKLAAWASNLTQLLPARATKLVDTNDPRFGQIGTFVDFQNEVELYYEDVRNNANSVVFATLPFVTGRAFRLSLHETTPTNAVVKLPNPGYANRYVLAFRITPGTTQLSSLSLLDSQGTELIKLALGQTVLVRGEFGGWSVLLSSGVSAGPSYTDAQARAAQLGRTAAAGTTTITLTAEAPSDYGTVASGSFTVDATNCVVGKVVRFAVGAGAGAPAFSNAPNSQPYKNLGVSYASGKAFSYSLLVCVDRIEVVTLAD